jgi:hypothetical protein
MSHIKETEEANNPSHYIVLTVAIAIGLVGVYLRFAGDSFLINATSNVILVVGIVIALRSVFKIMK